MRTTHVMRFSQMNWGKICNKNIIREGSEGPQRQPCLLWPQTFLSYLIFEWAEMRHADVSWPFWELIWFWSSSVDFPHFVSILTLWNRPNLQFMGIFLRTQGRNGFKIGMLMYSDHFQNRLDFGHWLLISLILVPFWLSETGQIWGFHDFLQNAWEEWPKIWHADASWPPFELMKFGSWPIGFPHFGTIFT